MKNFQAGICIVIALLFASNVSMAESYLCQGVDANTNMSYSFEYNPVVNECKFFLYSGDIKTDKTVDFLQKEAGIPNRQAAEAQVLKHYQDHYNDCMRDREVAANDYRQGKCKKLVVKSYTNGSQKCEDKYLDGKKVSGSCVGR